MQRLIPVFLIITVLTGCIERTMLIESEPQGATVYLDGDHIGETPVIVPFTTYGTSEVILQRQNYTTAKEYVRVSAPWFAMFPIDFFTDVLYPGTIVDHQEFAFRLEPLEVLDLTGLRERADEFVEEAQQTLHDVREERGVAHPAPPAE